eukprot:763402-Hanusia_phi.AAC.2
MRDVESPRGGVVTGGDHCIEVDEEKFVAGGRGNQIWVQKGYLGRGNPGWGCVIHGESIGKSEGCGKGSRRWVVRWGLLLANSMKG